MISVSIVKAGLRIISKVFVVNISKQVPTNNKYLDYIVFIKRHVIIID